MGMIRVGSGCDLHRMEVGRNLILCGVRIPYEKGLLGHSDADVAVHAVIDSLLGALALGDIGGFFPDTDPQYKDADSMQLLKQVLEDSRFRVWRVGNLDLTVIAQRPKLAPYIMEMRQSLAKGIGIPVDCVSVKAKTAEGLGEIGRCEAMEARAVVLLTRESAKGNGR